MKIKYKLLILMVFLGISFIIMGSLLLFQFSLLTFTLITVGLYTLTALLMYLIFVKRIERLNKELGNIQAGVLDTLKIDVTRQDEISEISSRINYFLDAIKLLRQQLYFLGDQSTDNTESLGAVLAKKMEQAKLEKEKNNNITLPDRIFFNEALNKTLSHIKRHHKIAAVLIVDIDLVTDVMGEKEILDSAIMKEITSRFASLLRNEDILAKLDGNEFIILIDDIAKPKFVSAVADKLIQSIATGVYVGYKESLLKVSIGICVCPNDANTLEELIEKTYTALYRAKSTAGNYYQFYTQELDYEARDYMNIKGALQKAIENKELVLHYQPKLNIKTGSIAGVEVLVRWMHPTLGLLSPDKFLDVAEDSGCIIAIGEWALREACKKNVYWQSEGYEHLAIAINLSTKQFFHPNLIKTIKIILEETKLSANYLELEVNEETMMRDLDKTTEIMKSLSEVGVRISIDHFGKASTSISHLKHLPISTIKIDRGFIQGVPLNPNDSAIASAIIALAHYLGIFALAEGVENAEQLQFLTQQRCDMVQGYFLSYPLPAETVVEQFKKISERVIT